MSEKTQLTRINVPAITDARYIEGMSDAFDKINDNFKKIASLPFLQGVQGDSYQLEEYKIWDNWILTEDGKILLDSIFEMDTTKDGNSFNDIRTCIGQIMPEENGVSPIDFFMSEDKNTIVNNSLYFYVIKDDTGNVIEKQLGQYYYFIDGRLKDIGNVYNDGVSLNGFNDYTGFYQYKYDSENNSKYVKVEILPTIYYDQNKNDICWKFNGNETGISAIGVKGADGKDADLLIVRVTANENDCTGLVNAIINPIGVNTAEDQWIDDPKDFKVGKALICIQRDNTAQDFAYGQVIKSGADYNAYWEPNYNFSKLIGNNRITNYFYNMGEDDTETSPFYLAIPSSYNRGASGTAENKMKAHVIKGSSETSEDLNIFYSENAFGSNGEQNRNVGATTSTKKLNIQNYNTTISKKLTVGGSAEVSGGLTVKNGGAVISSGGIQVTTQKPKAAPGTKSDADVKSNVLIGHNNPGAGKYNYFTNDITNCGYPLVTMSYAVDGSELKESKDCMVFGSGDICALKWNGTKYEKGELCLQDILGYYGKTKVGGDLDVVSGTASFGGAVTMKSSLGVTGGATFSGTATFNNPVILGSSASLTVGGSATFNDTSSFNKPVELGSSASLTVGGSATFNDTSSFNKPVELGSSASLTVGGSATFDDTATFNSTSSFKKPVTLGSSLRVSGKANFSSPVTIPSTLNVTNKATFAGVAYFKSKTTLKGLVEVTNDEDSSDKDKGALVVTGGVGIGGKLNVGSSTNISGKITGNDRLEIKKGATITGGSFIVNTDDYNFSIKASSGYGIDCDDQGSMVIKTQDLNIEGVVSMPNSLSVTGCATINNELNVTGGIQVTTQKPKASPGPNNYADVKSNVLIGHNNPGNDGYKDFPNDITKGGYPLVTMSYNTDGSESKNCLVFGNGDIYALNWNGTKYEPGTLCLQDRTDYFGKTLIGGSFEVARGTASFGGSATFNNPVTINSNLGVTGAVNIGSTTDTSGATSGALVVTGGVGIGKQLYVGGTNDSTSTKTGALVVTGGVGIGKQLYVGGTNDSSSTSTGALVVTGGVGIGKQLYVGSATDTSGATSGALVVTGGVGIGKQLYVGGTNDSSSTSTGALVVTGGVGIGKQLYVGNQLVINKDGSNSSSTSASEIYGYYANKFTGGTSDGGTGLLIYGGSGKKTNDNNHGKGGVGLIVKGGTAGDFTGSTSEYAGYGGTGLVVYGGKAGHYQGQKTSRVGAAIKTHGDVVIGDIDGNNITRLSSDASEFKISRKTTLSNGATINGSLSAETFIVPAVKYSTDTSNGASKYGAQETRQLLSGGIISGADKRIAWNIQSAPEGAIIIVTGGKGPGWRTNLSSNSANGNYVTNVVNAYEALTGGIYRIVKAKSSTDDKFYKEIYLLCSPYVNKQEYLHEETVG